MTINLSLLPPSSSFPSLPPTSIPTIPRHHAPDTLIVIMGATGTGKSKLSIDLATRFASEIVNSDKIQVYAGLDITTNKIPLPDRRGVPHHLLGLLDPAAGELTAAAFCSLASAAVESIRTRRNAPPVIAGGSNSFIHALVTRKPAGPDPFGSGFGSLRYRCCFIWVDVERRVLREYLDRRVEEMVGSGMVEELEGYFGNKGVEWERNVGLNKAIGVKEMEGYFGKRVGLEEAMREIKENTWRLAEEQVRKIRRLRESGWELMRVDATSAVRKREEGRWGRDVVGPAFGAVEKFLDEDWRKLLLPASCY